MEESESSALPLGDTPLFETYKKKIGWDRWIRTIGMTESKSVALPLGYIPSHSYLKSLNYYIKYNKKMQVVFKLFLFLYICNNNC